VTTQLQLTKIYHIYHQPELIPHREQHVSIINNIQCSIVSSASAHTLHRTQPVSSIKTVQPQHLPHREHSFNYVDQS